MQGVLTTAVVTFLLVAHRRLAQMVVLRILLVALAGITSVLLVIKASAGVLAVTSPPNVVLIITDDMRSDGLMSMPNLRHLADRGVVFSHGFVTTPVCTPSRASILTGQYAHNNGVLRNSQPNGGVSALDDTSTIATWLQDAGVRTGMIGRYMTQYDSEAYPEYVPPGWDTWFGIWETGDLYYRYKVNDNGTARYFATDPEEYSTRVITREALSFLEQEPDRPFFLMLTPRTPHKPATEDDLDMGDFKDREIELPPSYDEEDVSDKPGWIQALPRLDEDSREEIEDFRRRQLGSLVSLDRSIAEIVDALQANGRLDQTWIIFMSDNGLMLGEHRIAITKACIYEECVRVPFIVIPPGGLDGGRTDDRIVANIDLAPTIAQIFGAEPGQSVDGQSFLPLINGESIEWRDAILLEHPEMADDERRFYAIRTGDRKYATYLNGEEELYDITADPYEMENLADDPSWAGEKQALAERLQELIGSSP